MGSLANPDEQHDHATSPAPILNTQEERRRRRAVALKAAEGLWRDRTDVPKDGVAYQEQLRAEWR